ncbi:hypothetical protein D9M68_913350 [compost metagenome]
MISEPLSVSCSWITSMSPGATPAASKAACEAVTVGAGACRLASPGLNTSKEPWWRVRISAARTMIGLSVKRLARLARHSTSAAPPSAGLQNMYLRSGRLTGADSAISS